MVFHHWAIRNRNLPWHVWKGNQTSIYYLPIKKCDFPVKQSGVLPSKLGIVHQKMRIFRRFFPGLQLRSWCLCGSTSGRWDPCVAAAWLSWYLGSIREIPKIVNCQDLEDYRILLRFLFGPEWIDMELYVCTWEYAFFSAWFRHGFWWLGMVSNGSLSVHTLLCILYVQELGLQMKWVVIHDCPKWIQMNVIKDRLRTAVLANVAMGFWSRQKKRFHTWKKLPILETCRCANVHPMKWWGRSMKITNVDITPYDD